MRVICINALLVLTRLEWLINLLGNIHSMKLVETWEKRYNNLPLLFIL